MRRPPEPVQVVGISGSLRPGSRTRPVLEQVLAALGTRGARSAHLDLAALGLPLFSGYRYPEAEEGAIDRLRAEVAAAKAVVLASPEYHGALGGGLKNALDLLPDGALRGKVVGLVAVAGGAVSPVGTAGQLRAVVRALGGLAAPNELLVSRVKTVTDARGWLAEPELLNRVGTFADGLLALAGRLEPQPTGLEVGV